MSLYSQPAAQLIGATADITTRQGDTYAAVLIRGCHAERLVLRPADAWIQIDAAADIATADVPLADTRIVHVSDRGTSRSYEGVTIRTVQLVWTCPACGRPRSEPRSTRFVEDGAYYAVHTWSNACGHVDSYDRVLVEAGWHSIPRPVEA